MPYSIEYMARGAVVHVKTPYASVLESVAGEARGGGATAKALFGADGFQIRDKGEDGKVVLAESMG
ncbi:MAG: hypothetical protein HY054_12490 [Proteobacteria bacterium]|nr:hypothetical protein [Pseudomonadota bacterium]